MIWALVVGLALAGEPAGHGVPALQREDGHGAPALQGEDKYILVGAGDIADCETDGDERTAKIVDEILRSSRNARAFTAGDNAYPWGRPEDFARCYAPSWGRFKERTLAVPGNHDYYTNNGAAFAAYFGFVAGAPFWRSVDVGPWHVVLLDSDCPPPDRAATPAEPVSCARDSAQARWLEDDLKKSDAKCTALIWHHPRFSSGRHGNDARTQALWEIAERHGADVIIAGHDHSYERFDRLTSRGERRETGVVSFVVGTGGRQAYPFRTRVPGSALRESGTVGVLVLELEESRARFRFLRDDGSVADKGTIECR